MTTTKVSVYGVWMLVGIVTFGQLVRHHVPWWLIGLVVLWGFLAGSFAFISASES